MRHGHEIASAIAAALGIAEQPTLRPMGGGCINHAACICFSDRRYFVKWNDRGLPHFFAAEAAGLQALLAADTRLAIPAPLAWHDATSGQPFLVTTLLESAPRPADFDEQLGIGLAELHAHTDARGFGFERDGYCGATPQPNAWRADWIEFYREQRLHHQVELAAHQGLARPAIALLERVLSRLPDLLEAGEPPALIHGDLWAGNLMAGLHGEPALIDPAAYFGHREAELGMMVLFGGFGPRVFSAYEAVRPLLPGWRERLPLYSLYHVLNHYNLFGGEYAEQATRIARRFV